MGNAADPELAMPADDGAVRDGAPEMAMPSEDVVPVTIVNTCFGLAQIVPAQGETPAAPGESADEPLSGRAINVLKMLADEIMGEVPPSRRLGAVRGPAAQDHGGAAVDCAQLRAANHR